MIRTLSLVLALAVAAPAVAGPPGLAPRAEPSKGRPAEAPLPPTPPTPPTPPGPPGVVEEVLAQEAEILDVLRQHDPGRAAELMALKEADPRAYVRELVRTARSVERFRTDPEFAARALRMREVHHELRERAREVRDLPAKEQRAAREELEALTAELLELKQAERRARLDELRLRLEELQAEIEERESQRSKLIDEYVDQLLREPVEL